MLPRLVLHKSTKTGIPGPTIGPGLPIATARCCASNGSVMRGAHGERQIGLGDGVLPCLFPRIPMAFRILEDDDVKVEGVL